MRNRAIVLGSMVALLPTIAHAAGETSARPQVHVIPPPAAGQEGVERDDLPGPPLEVVTRAPNIRLPAIPDFVRTGDARSATAPGPPPVSVVTQAPQRKIVTIHARNLSIDSLNACNDAITARRYKAALGACRSAIAAWGGNHLAWYGTANAHMARDEWTQAAVALERAVALRPDLAMYQMMYGIALYEAEIARARQERARKNRKESEDGRPDPTVLKLDAAREALVRATTIAPNLWRAHSYLGYLYRDLRDPRAAAEELTAALKANPGDRASYVALTELYRRAKFHAQALAVAVVGTANVPQSAELWFEAAMSYEALNDDDKAIDALTKGLAVAPNSVILKLQRGRLLYQARHRADLARRDLEPVASSTDPTLAPARQLAELLLVHLAGGPSPQDAYRTCRALNGCKIFKDLDMAWLAEDWSEL